MGGAIGSGNTGPVQGEKFTLFSSSPFRNHMPIAEALSSELLFQPQLHTSPKQTSHLSEFNIQVDPEAAKIVFEAGVPLTMVPIEVTHTALVTPAVLGRLLTGSRPGGVSKFKALTQQLLMFFAGSRLVR
jgi:inosine-uridine nucleoside N-ribohydrolase